MMKLLFTIPGVLMLGAICAQTVPVTEIEPRKYELPIKAERTISFETTEGSHMNVDISPDGKTLVFDLLGDLYTIPADGGKATQLTRGIAIHVCPVWSPDGKLIAYLSDETGFFHLTVRNVEGTFVLTYGIMEKQFDMDSYNVPIPVWSADGTFVAAGQSLYHVDGNRITFEKDLPGYVMAILPDGDYYYHTANTKFDGGTDSVYRWTESRNEAAAVMNYDRSQKLAADGKMIAYRSNDSLVLVSLDNNIVRTLCKFPHEGIIARNYSFSKDNKLIYLSHGGKIHRVQTATGRSEEIPYLAQVNVDLGSLKYNKFSVPRDSISVRNIRHARRSPDGKRIVFSCLNKLYMMALPNGRPQLLVNDPIDQLHPAWSPDGKWIAFVSYSGLNDDGYLWKVSSGGGKPKKLINKTGIYERPCWSPDGKSIMVSVKYSLEDIQQVVERDVKVIIVKSYLSTFSGNGEDVFIQRGSMDSGFFLTERNKFGGIQARASVPVFGSNDLLSMSPDKRYIIYRASENLFLVPVANLDKKQLLYTKDTSVFSPMIKIAAGAWDPVWEEGGSAIGWTSGNKYCRVMVGKVMEKAAKYFQNTPNKDLAGYPYVIDAIEEQHEEVLLDVKVARSYGKGTVVLKNGKVLIMRDGGVIEKGGVVVKDGIITWVGRTEDLKVPAGSTVFNLDGKTIMPGFIDLHDHVGVLVYDACLSFGITTARNPSATNEDYLNTEMVAAGRLTGPRYYTSGKTVNQSSGVNCLDDAKAFVRESAKCGGVFMKQYTLPSRIQKQWLLLASQEFGLNMTNEGRSFWEQLGMIKDGTAGIEHAIFNTLPSREFSDIAMLWAKSGTYFAPTLINTDSGPTSSRYFRSRYEGLDSVKLKRFWTGRMPEYSLVDTNTNYKTNFREMLYASIRKLGGNVGMDSHGDDAGIGSHYAIWALQRGGLSNYEALECSTIIGAGALGIQADVGSIEVGKIADLIILDKDPLVDIHNTTSIKYVMKGGILYDDETLDIVWPKKKKNPKLQSVAVNIPEWRKEKEEIIGCSHCDHQHDTE